MSKLLVFLYLSMATDPTPSPIQVTTQLRKDVRGSQNSRCKGPGAGTRLVPISGFLKGFALAKSAVLGSSEWNAWEYSSLTGQA